MKKVIVAMSGGVDSSVAAYLLKNEGYIVEGATMILLDDSKTDDMLNDAKDVCNHLGIKHHVFDFKEEFKNIVINNFINSYKEGSTPNPCIVCNKFFKFGLFYDEAKKIGADLIATGHYVKIEDSKLIMSKTKDKDQSYFLYSINRDVLDHIMFPLANFSSKDEVREIAKEAGLTVSNKKDSQEVCFVPNDDYTGFLEASMDNLSDKGNIILEDGTIIGKHKGLIYYTIGQRKGLGVSYHGPMYVISIDTINNNIVVGPNESLFRNKLIANSINLLVDKLPEVIYAKIRSRSNKEEASVKFIDDKNIEVYFTNKQRAITRGQSVVFYDEDDICLGGGIITDVLD